MITLFALVTVLTIFTVAGTALIRQQSLLTVRSEQRLSGGYIAAAGLQLVLENLQSDPTWGTAGTPETFLLDVTPDGSMQARVTVWNNYCSSTEIPGPAGVVVRPGDAFAESVAVLRGTQLVGELGTARSTLVKPPAVFNHAVFDNDDNMFQKEGDAWMDSYDSLGVTSPFLPENPTDVYLWETGQPTMPSTVPPYDGRGGASLRCNGEIRSQIPVFGDAYLPTGAKANLQEHYGVLIRDDSPHYPLIFKTPPSLSSAPVQPVAFNTPLPPGNYDEVVVPDNQRLILSRGDFRFARLELGEGCEIVLEEDTTPPLEPAVVYLEESLVGGVDLLVNMRPANPGERESEARELQLYFTDGPGTSNSTIRFENGTRFRGIIAGHNLRLARVPLSGLGPETLPDPSPAGRHGIDYFGAMYAKAFQHESGERYHYDRSLRDQPLEGETQWVLVNRGNLKR